MARRTPPAEVTVDPPLLRALLAEQHPDLAALPVTALAHGWDNELFRLGPDLVARLPRRAAAAALVEHELRWLPELADGLPLPVPVPSRAGRPGAGYPWSWCIAPYLPGVSAAAGPPFDTVHAAEVLGRFLARLHRPAPTTAPVNPFRGVPLGHRAAAFDEHLAHAPEVDPDAARELWQRSVTAPPWPGPPVWLHGDLHPANIFVDHAHVSAVIDFGDLTGGDPATDLSVAWTLLPPGDRVAFWKAYDAHAGHPVDPPLRQRARGWALALGTAVLASSADNPLMHAMGARAARAALAG